MTNEDRAVPLRRIAFADLEASGLGSAGFPTEIGWAIIREDGSVESGSYLIRPPSKWTFFGNAWSAASERLTGITREMLDSDGLPPREALMRFLDAIGDRDLLSDEPGYDDHWLGMLADAAAISLGGRKLGDAKELIEQIGAKHGLEFERRETLHIEEAKSPRAADAKHGLEFDEPPRHRAEADARRLAMACARVITRAPTTGDDTYTENPMETPT